MERLGGHPLRESADDTDVLLLGTPLLNLDDVIHTFIVNRDVREILRFIPNPCIDEEVPVSVLTTVAHSVTFPFTK